MVGGWEAGRAMSPKNTLPRNVGLRKADGPRVSGTSPEDPQRVEHTMRAPIGPEAKSIPHSRNTRARGWFEWKGEELLVHDAQGKLLHRFRLEGAGMQPVHTAQWAPGLYSLQVAGRSVVSRLAVKH